MDNQSHKRYWRENLQYLAILLFIWFLVSFGFGILWVEQLNGIRIGGFKLGFWFAQQGSIYVFVILIFVYVLLMNRLDRKYSSIPDGHTDLDLYHRWPFLYALHRYRHLVTRQIDQGFLRGLWRSFPLGQRPGHGGRLDVGGILFGHGRDHRLFGL